MNDGGPAFPTQYSNEADGPTVMPSVGMSLRDYFAAQAIPFIQWNAKDTGLCAKRCYEIADAMLKAREGK